ncbi:rhomboid-like protein [Mycolicibacterium sp. CH28]|uniref:rhomboid-like protein n=1 Tax=Mycolicibacterium sp. CH28 TaxID=2512237 RepID=UPI001F165466|nr:rhomboid-like protein [Mycolicibacterium sp. CH28]
MVSSFFARLVRVRVTLGYTAALLAVASVLVVLGPHIRDQVIRHASTNLHNLGEGRLGTLIGSAFVIETGPVYVWLPGLFAILGLAELLWRSRRMAVAFVVGHVGATLLVAAGLAAALAAGLTSWSIVNVTDVGMSYGAVGVLGALTAAIPQPWRPAWTGWWLGVAVASAVATVGDFTNVGHATALVLGMAVGTRFGHPAHWTTARYGLLAVAVAFGYMIMANTPLVIAATAGSGAVVAVLADRAVALHHRRRLARPITAVPERVAS